MISDRMDINRVLAEMRNIKAQTQNRMQTDAPQGADQVSNALKQQSIKSVDDTSGFGQILNQAVNSVNDLQKASGALATAYEQGKPGVDVTDVMIASQKASVSFQGMVQVRNKVVEAYRDVMNMPV